jgi:hypothetical protein
VALRWLWVAEPNCGFYDRFQPGNQISGSIGRGFTSNRDMKRIMLVGAVAMAVAGLCLLADGQGVLHRGLAAAPPMPWPGNGQSNVIIIPSPPGTSPIPFLAPSGNPAFRIQPSPPGARLHPPAVPPTGLTNLYWILRSNPIVVPAAPPIIPPGVYKTTPYSCIVVVPGPHPDDKCIVNPGSGNSPMPIIKPDVRFIPWGPAK